MINTNNWQLSSSVTATDWNNNPTPGLHVTITRFTLIQMYIGVRVCVTATRYNRAACVAIPFFFCSSTVCAADSVTTPQPARALSRLKNAKPIQRCYQQTQIAPEIDSLNVPTATDPERRGAATALSYHSTDSSGIAILEFVRDIPAIPIPIFLHRVSYIPYIVKRYSPKPNDVYERLLHVCKSESINNEVVRRCRSIC